MTVPKKMISGSVAAYMADIVKTATLLHEQTTKLQWETCYGDIRIALQLAYTIKKYLRELKHAIEMFEHCSNQKDNNTP